MKFLPLNFTFEAKKLRPKYYWLLGLVSIGGIVASFVPTVYFAVWLAHALHLKDELPVRDQENGLWWMVGFFVFFAVSATIGHVGGYLCLAVCLRRFRGWTPRRIRELIFESRLPPHWFKPDRDA